MAEEHDNLALVTLCAIRSKQDEHSAQFDEIEAVLKGVRPTVTSHDLRFDALEERVETIREGTVTAIGYAAHASRAHVDLCKQIADRVEKLETGR
jgi:uncharacterized DUF497 family protein